jgi:glycosyltransferase involved in cell wall biosynthesis
LILQVAMKIFVVNDFHPGELQGAATIAYNYHQELCKTIDSRFYSGSKASFSNGQINEVFLGYKIPNGLMKYKISNKLNQYLGKSIATSRLIAAVLTNRPKLVWFHQIGHRFGFVSIILIKLLGVNTVLTFHDFGGIKKGKLYPHDLGLLDSEVDNWINLNLDRDLHIQTSNVTKSPTNFLGYFSWQYLRRFYIRSVSHYFVGKLLYISKLQQTIYCFMGFKRGLVIPNPIEPCNCTIVRDSTDDKTKSILFAGRAIGKGLEKTAQAVSMTDFKLHLAGKVELLTRALTYLPPEQIVYHGEVSRQDLFLLIHKMDLVSVPSICFDVYPTVTIESLSHGTPVLTHRTCGGIDVLPSSSLYLQSYEHPINLGEISFSKVEKFTSNNISDLIVQLKVMFREIN